MRINARSAPDWIGEWGIHYWNHAVDHLRDELQERDLPLLETYADAWQRFHDARLIVEERGAISISEKGAEYQHPAVGIMNKAAERIRQLAAMLNMAPACRKPLQNKQRQENPIDAMLKEHLGRG